MKTKHSFVSRLRIYKIVALVVMVILAAALLVMLIIDSELSKTIKGDIKLILIFILALISLFMAFLTLTFDFLLMKKHYDITSDLDELAFLDRLTGLPNRFSVDCMSEKYNSREKMLHLGCILITINNLKEMNDTKGREGGDKVISDFCNILESVGHRYGHVGRNSGNEFLVIIEECDQNVMELFLGDFQRRIHNHNTIEPDYPIESSYTSVLSDDIMADHFYQLITTAYERFGESAQTLY